MGWAKGTAGEPDEETKKAQAAEQARLEAGLINFLKTSPTATALRELGCEITMPEIVFHS